MFSCMYFYELNKCRHINDKTTETVIVFNEMYFWFQIFSMVWMLYALFWVISRRLNFICRCFGTHCLSHLHRQIGMKNDYSFFIPMKIEQSVPKCQHMKFRHRGITQKKAYDKMYLFCKIFLYPVPSLNLE